MCVVPPFFYWTAGVWRSALAPHAPLVFAKSQSRRGRLLASPLPPRLLCAPQSAPDAALRARFPASLKSPAGLNQIRDLGERHLGGRPAVDCRDPVAAFHASEFGRRAGRRNGPPVIRYAPGALARSRLCKNLSADSYPTTRSTSLPRRSKKMIPGGPNRLKRLSSV